MLLLIRIVMDNYNRNRSVFGVGTTVTPMRWQDGGGTLQNVKEELFPSVLPSVNSGNVRMILGCIWLMRTQRGQILKDLGGMYSQAPSIVFLLCDLCDCNQSLNLDQMFCINSNSFL